MSFQRKSREAAERFAERRELERQAPRLRDRIATLETLELEIEHDNHGRPCPGTKYVRHVSVATGPALFWAPCSDESCVGGGHEITAPVMRALSARKTEFTGSDPCSGSIGSAPCERVMLYTARASYR